jgi:hypothetical protein
MSSKVAILKAPRPELIHLAGLLDDAIQRYLERQNQVEETWRWEAPIEGIALSSLCLRNIEAVTLLATHDEVLAPAAWANARNAFEVALRVVWLLHPTDRFASEARWLGLLHDYERFHSSMTRFEHAHVIPQKHREIAWSIRQFRLAVEDRLPSGYTPVKRAPPIADILREVDAQDLYAAYKEGSQFLHGSMAATALFRRHLGTAKSLGDYTSIADWILPLRICWLALKTMAPAIINRLSDEPASFEWGTVVPAMDRAFRELALTHRDPEPNTDICADEG